MAVRKPPDSPTRLTEFAPLSSDTRPSGSFFSRLFKRKGSVPVDDSDENSSPSGSDASSREPSLLRDAAPPQTSTAEKGEDAEWDAGPAQLTDTEDIPADGESIASSCSGGQPRTLSSVLRSLSNILDRRSQTPQAYKDSDFKQFWMPDSDCRECYECSDRFNTFRRRHHCRVCGQIFCSRCCNQEVPGKIMGYTGYLRVCTYCCKVVLSYAQHQEASGDLRALSEDLKHLSSVEDCGSYTETGAWTPTARRKGSKASLITSLFNKDKLRSSSSPDLHSPTSSQNPFDVTPLSEYSRVDTFQHERRILIQDSVQLRGLWLLMQHPVDGIEIQNHRHRLRTHPNCVVGGELVDWLVLRDKVADRVQAVAIGQALVDAKWLECVTSAEQVFRDEYSLYRPGEATVREHVTEVPVATSKLTIGDDEDNAPSWFREIRRIDEDVDSLSELNKIPSTVSGCDLADGGARSVFYVDGTQLPELPPRPKPSIVSSSSSISSDRGSLDHSYGVPTETCPGGIKDELFKGALAASTEKIQVNEVGWQKTEHLREENGERQACETFSKVYQEHLQTLTHQLLTRAGLSLKWAETVTSVTCKVAQVVRPDVRHEGDDMDIRQYIQLKKIPGGTRAMTNIVCGVVCTKNVTHRKMRQHIVNPRVLLLHAPIEYQRVENKFSSLEPQILQEDKFLKNCVGRIAGLEPDILLVEKSASRVAQEFLLHSGITLVINVKPSVMERVARFTQADIASSVDGLVSKTSLGFCHTFRLHSFTMPSGVSKTLMYFDGCASHLGCTVILRGGSLPELRRVKKIMQFMTYATYHGKLETAFLMDEFAMPPALPIETEFPIAGSPVRPDGTSESQKGTSESRKGTGEGQKGTSESQKGTGEGQEGTGKSRKGTGESQNKGTSENLKGISEIQKGTSESRNVTSESQKGTGESQKGTSERVEVAEEAVPGSVATKNVVALFEESERNVDVEFKMAAIHDELRAKQTESALVEQMLAEDSITTTAGMMSSQDGGGIGGSTVTSGSAAEKATGQEPVVAATAMSRSSKRLSREMSSVTAEVVQDFSDPLQHYQKSRDESIFAGSSEALREEVRAVQHHFRQALDDVVLTVSPCLTYDVPYLQTEAGERCLLRVHFPRRIFWSRALETTERGEKTRQKFETERAVGERSLRDRLSEAQRDEPHPFVTAKLTFPLADPNTQTLLVDFRARGGRIQYPAYGSLGAGERVPFRAVPEERGLPLSGSWERNIDCLDPYLHQRIAVLFSSFSYVSNNTPNPCVNPWIVSMDFYGRNDITLGGFLERYCFRETYSCPSESCDTPMVDHIRRFVHDNGCIQIVLKKLDAPTHGYQNSILTWAWCRRCKQVTPVAPLSLESWSMSFAKYLELRFHGIAYTRRTGVDACAHSIHHEHYQYFGSNQIVASFKFVPVQLKEVVLPPILVLLRDSGVPLSQLIEDAKTLSSDGCAVYGGILDHLQRLQRDAQTDAQVALLAEYIAREQTQTDLFRECVEEIQTKLSAAIPIRDRQTKTASNIDNVLGRSDFWRELLAPVAHDITDSIVEVKRQIADAVNSWNNRIQDFEQQQRKLDKVRGTSSIGTKGSRDALNTPDTVWETVPPPTWPKEEPVDLETEPTFFISQQQQQQQVSDITLPGVSGALPQPADQEADTSGRRVDRTSEQATLGNPALTGLTDLSGSEGSLSAVEKSWEYVEAATRDADPAAKGHARSKSLGDSRRMSKQLTLPHDSSANELDRLERSSKAVKQLFNSFLSSTDSAAVNMPFSADEHHLLPPGDSVPVIVYDQEPSSIIAYTLCSAEYERQLRELKSDQQREQQTASPSTRRNKRDSASATSGSDQEPEDFSIYGPQSDSDKLNRSKLTAPIAHIELQFADNTAKFYCRVYFADQFRTLRKIIFPAGEQRYIRSLSRCFTWLARGGKSGSTFCKTQDDRFILKQMSRLEVQSFVDFAPHYFQYITQCQAEEKPTVLAKILGVYRIGYRNNQTNMALKQDLLVMENLFYDRQITQIFDLKGSMRNRLVNTSGKRVEDLVLLDENLLKFCVDSPLYIRAHSKTALTMAITNDTQFLSSHLVMDYSLLVGIDEAKRELVVGIIDYIRTFTWDKKLEMVFKSTYSQLGGQGKMPTVVSPELYRSRFLEAMDRYFLLVPDQWAGLGRSIEC